jgi:hypothetical protein
MKKKTVAVVCFFILTLSPFINYAQYEKPIFEKNGLKIFTAKPPQNFPEAELKLLSPTIATIPEGKDTFTFEVKNYTLGVQTPDAGERMCANSAKGQHIHFIMDNAPYIASYIPQIPADLKHGHHVLLAFLSRSYHESIKQKKAYVLKEFNVGKAEKNDFDAKAPHLFFSRPKGEYIGDKEVKRVMLDFYLINCTLSSKGYKVKATINGTEFLFDKWQPYFIEGLPLGATKIKLELIDKKGMPVKSAYNGTERTITLRNEPLKN